MDINEVDQNVNRLIKKFGFTVIAVLGDSTTADMPFAYTIGLEKSAGHPEICMVGFDTGLMQQLLNDAGKLIINGQKMLDGTYQDKVIQNFPVAMRDAPNHASLDEIFVRAFVHYGQENGFRMTQMFLPDAKGKFPWDASCNSKYRDMQNSLLKFDFSSPSPKLH